MESHFPTEEPATIEPDRPPLGRDEQCPWCGEDNQCRVAKGHLYKGPCWCHEIVVPAHLLRRLAAEQVDPGCLCRPCLETLERLANDFDDADALLAEARRVTNLKHDYYLDDRGNVVFTSRYHLKRGTCCANDCRHCPY